jgi:iron uptake system EfeUOB component EfeO/EfeM
MNFNMRGNPLLRARSVAVQSRPVISGRSAVVALRVMMAPASRKLLPAVAAFAFGLMAAKADTRPDASLDAAIEQYRAFLVQDIDRTMTSARRLRASLDARDVAAAKQAWIDARVGWERSEVFTSGFAPELDHDIDAWPNGMIGFHAIEAKLFGANRIDVEGEVEGEVDVLLQNLSKLSTTAHDIRLTHQGLLNGLTRLAYEVGESKLDGGESRLSGTSIDDMRNNIEGIDLAYRTIFAAKIERHDRELAAAARGQIDDLRKMLEPRDLRHLDLEKLRAVSEGLVLTLQGAAPRIALERPTLE